MAAALLDSETRPFGVGIHCFEQGLIKILDLFVHFVSPELALFFDGELNYLLAYLSSDC